MDIKQIKQLRAQGKTLLPLVHLGKQGITDALIEEINVHLKKRGLVKIKVLRSALLETTKEQLAESICSKTKSTLIEFAGLMLVIFRRPMVSIKKEFNKRHPYTK